MCGIVFGNRKGYPKSDADDDGGLNVKNLIKYIYKLVKNNFLGSQIGLSYHKMSTR